MRYHIDTIPVWDAAKIDGECLLCALQRRVELQQIEYSLGASVMEPDVRIQVNQKGFCQHHQRMLFKGDNRLGHALMLESHLTETRGKLNKAFNDIRKAASGNSSFFDCPAKRRHPPRRWKPLCRSLTRCAAPASSATRLRTT